MKTAALLMACIMTASTNINASDDKPAALNDLRWKNRVFLVYVQLDFNTVREVAARLVNENMPACHQEQSPPVLEKETTRAG